MDLFHIADLRKEGARAYCDCEVEGGITCNDRALRNARFISETIDGQFKPAPYTDKLIRIGGVEPMQDKEDGIWCIYRVRCFWHHEVPEMPSLDYEKHNFKK